MVLLCLGQAIGMRRRITLPRLRLILDSAGINNFMFMHTTYSPKKISVRDSSNRQESNIYKEHLLIFKPNFMFPRRYSNGSLNMNKISNPTFPTFYLYQTLKI